MSVSSSDKRCHMNIIWYLFRLTFKCNMLDYIDLLHSPNPMNIADKSRPKVHWPLHMQWTPISVFQEIGTVNSNGNPNINWYEELDFLLAYTTSWDEVHEQRCSSEMSYSSLEISSNRLEKTKIFWAIPSLTCCLRGLPEPHLDTSLV